MPADLSRCNPGQQGRERIPQLVTERGEEFILPLIGDAQRLFRPRALFEVLANLVLALAGSQRRANGRQQRRHLRPAARGVSRCRRSERRHRIRRSPPRAGSARVSEGRTTPVAEPAIASAVPVASSRRTPRVSGGHRRRSRGIAASCRSRDRSRRGSRRERAAIVSWRRRDWSAPARARGDRRCLASCSPDLLIARVRAPVPQTRARPSECRGIPSKPGRRGCPPD